MKTLNKGVLLSFEGPDGCGKTTQLENFVSFLKEEDYDFIVTREPGGTELGEQIRQMLLTKHMHIETELLLFMAARKEHLEQIIFPAMAQGKIVVSDRFCDSTYAYQGCGRGLSLGRIRLVESLFIGGFKPDLTFLFDLDPEIAQKRMEGTREKDRFEQEQVDFHTRVINGFRDRANADKKRFRIIDASQPVNLVTENMISNFREWATCLETN